MKNSGLKFLTTSRFMKTSKLRIHFIKIGSVSVCVCVCLLQGCW